MYTIHIANSSHTLVDAHTYIIHAHTHALTRSHNTHIHNTHMCVESHIHIRTHYYARSYVFTLISGNVFTINLFLYK